MRKLARTDANQPAIVDLLRRAGARVLPLHNMGGGVPDLLLGYHGRLALVEIKDGTKPPSARRLTPDEERWHAAWAEYPVFVVSTDDEALAMLEALRA